MKVLVVINPKSGMRIGDKVQDLFKEAAEKYNFEYKFYQMGGNKDEAEIRNDISCYRPEVVAGVGGDGTINLLSGLLLNSDISLLIVPAGSANGMAKELGIDRIADAVDLLSTGNHRKIDVLEINRRVCIHLADVGLNARIVKRFEQGNTRGKWSYARHLLSELFLIKQYRFYIRCDNKEISRKAVSLTFANASRYGTGAVINPVGKINDGRFELVIVKPFPLIKLLSITWKMFRGTLDTSEYVEVISCQNAYVRSRKKTTLQVDGEVIGKTKHFHIQIIRGALKVLVPPDAEA